MLLRNALAQELHAQHNAVEFDHGMNQSTAMLLAITAARIQQWHEYNKLMSVNGRHYDVLGHRVFVSFLNHY